MTALGSIDWLACFLYCLGFLLGYATRWFFHRQRT